MADTYNPTQGNPTYDQLFAHYNSQYLPRASSGTRPGDTYANLGTSGSNVTGAFGIPAQKVGLTNLLQMLLQQGRVDPRLLASAQAQNSRSTQSQMDAARANASSRGFGNSGLSAALQAAIGSAGANRSARCSRI